MPELPEVETIRRDLEEIGGQKIKVTWAREGVKVLKRVTAQELMVKLRGKEVGSLERKGKYLRIKMREEEEELVVHLGMTGQLYISDGEGEVRHVHLKMQLSNGKWLIFRDPRRFGRIMWGRWEDLQKEGYVALLGVDLLSEDFTLDYIEKMLDGKRRSIKIILLDQRGLAGLGNIYTDESLFEAGVLPQRQGGTLNEDEVSRLYIAINKVIKRGLDNRGTSLVDFIDGKGNLGQNQKHLMVYGRKGKPCWQCGEKIMRIVVGGRGTYFCVHCQQ